MKNLYIEGIQGAGKSTLTNTLARKYPEYTVCREGDYNPVELAWCTYMDKADYEAVLLRYPSMVEEIKAHTTVEGDKYIVTYTRILTDEPGFHKDLENYEIYNGRKAAEELKQIVLSRHAAFRGEGYIFECSFFQNVMEDLILFQQLSDDEIVEFYKQLFDQVDKEHFKLIYLYSEDIAENIRVIRKERSDNAGNEMWYPLMLGFLVNCPYGKAHGYKDFEDLISHFEHRQRLEMRIINEVIGDNAEIIKSKSEY